ncbi:hypothetical protein ASD99_24540 [Mesorhizobium sp. Root695]|uniref:DUF768 domain-containing protein n=1 Tax=Mesorhizobium sp. Root695 TaxID=1736589 RepID=UPI000710E0A1|nr:DUF768 domain-containing protein [Mesorhizobium sp. Root695]KRB29821.1 hypothetical protein ASD99_24540 [Mesorhizobium sp. Root695]
MAATMATRGINFLDKWMAEQLPESATDDPIVISDLADKAMRAADKAGIPTAEISEEVPSVFEVIAEALEIAKAARLDPQMCYD